MTKEISGNIVVKGNSDAISLLISSSASFKEIYSESQPVSDTSSKIDNASLNDEKMTLKLWRTWWKIQWMLFICSWIM